MSFFFIPFGILSSSMHVFKRPTSLKSCHFLNLAFSIASANSSNPITNFLTSMNLGIGTYSPSPPLRMYVAIPQWGCAVNVTIGLPRYAEAYLDTGETTGTGNQSSGFAYPVCSCTSLIRSGIVYLPFSNSSRVILPVNDTGWKFTPRMISELSNANLIMSPIWWSFTPLTIVGTRTTDGGCSIFLRLSSTCNLTWNIFLFLAWMYGSSVTPSNER